MTFDQPSYGKNMETCEGCKAVSHLLNLESLIRLRDERPNFNHIHREDGKLIAFSSEHRRTSEKKLDVNSWDWWAQANERRQFLILEKHQEGGAGLSREQAVELQILQDLAESIMNAVSPPPPRCDHNWVDARNEIVQSGELCLKCFSIRAGNSSEKKT